MLSRTHVQCSGRCQCGLTITTTDASTSVFAVNKYNATNSNETRSSEHNNNPGSIGAAGEHSANFANTSLQQTNASFFCQQQRGYKIFKPRLWKPYVVLMWSMIYPSKHLWTNLEIKDDALFWFRAAASLWGKNSVAPLNSKKSCWPAVILGARHRSNKHWSSVKSGAILCWIMQTSCGSVKVALPPSSYTHWDHHDSTAQHKTPPLSLLDQAII